MVLILLSSPTLWLFLLCFVIRSSRKYSYSSSARISISWVGELGGSVRPNNLKKCMKLNWNFQLEGKKSCPWERYGYFLHYTVYTLLLVCFLIA